MSHPLALLVFVLALAACNDSSFSGTAKKAGVPKKEPKAAPVAAPKKDEDGGATGTNPGTGTSLSQKVPATPAAPGPKSPPTAGDDLSSGLGTGPMDAVVIPEACDESGVTQADLLTKELPNYVPGNFAEYLIYLTDCNGKVQPLTSELMAFDVDATGGAIGKGLALNFQITDDKAVKELAHGTLAEIPGTDLFGHSGTIYFHYESATPISVDAGAKSFRLRVGIPDACCAATGAADPAADQLIATYLRFGKAAPVKKVVKFRAAPPP